MAQTMTRDEALKAADEILLALMADGDPAIMEAARGPDGRIDQTRLVRAAMRARERLADRLMAEAEQISEEIMCSGTIEKSALADLLKDTKQ